MKKSILMGMAAFSMLIASCGGSGSGEGTDKDTTAKDTMPVITTTEYDVDTATSMVSWKSYGKVGDTSQYHLGSLNIQSGSITAQDSAGAWSVTAGTLTFDMASAKESAGMVKLDEHLKQADFFNVAQFATSSFTFEGFDGTNATGTLSILGKTVSISAPAVITITPETVNVEVSMFLIDFLALEVPFFVAEKGMKPEKQHDPKVEVTLSINANKKM